MQGIRNAAIAVGLLLITGLLVRQLPKPQRQPAPQPQQVQAAPHPAPDVQPAPRRETEPEPEPEPEPERLTLALFNALETGMSQGDAVQLLGQEGVVISANEFGQGTEFHVTTEMREFKDGFRVIHLMFQNGKLMQKSQFGLR